MKRVLFVCIHNSARSQMAQAFLQHFSQGKIEASSAGLEAGKLNPLVVTLMQEIGIDISHHQTQTVADVLARHEHWDYVITVCDAASGERCPVFPVMTKRLHWSFEDPSAVTGLLEERQAKIRIIRDAIAARIKQWLEHEIV